MAHHMLVPAIYHSAIRLMLVKGPRLVLRSAPHRTARAGGPTTGRFPGSGTQVEAATEPVLGQGLCVIGTQLRASDHLPPICCTCELSHSWMDVRYVCPPPP